MNLNDPAELDRIQAVCDAATEGPWFASDILDSGRGGVVTARNEMICGYTWSWANSQFVALARTALPLAIAALREKDALQARVAEMERELEGDQRHYGDVLERAHVRITTLEAELAGKTAECASRQMTAEKWKRLRDDAVRERDTALKVQHALNALAVIHRDGGHYTADHGFEKSCADAADMAVNARAEIETLRDNLAAAWEELDRDRLVEAIQLLSQWLSKEFLHRKTKEKSNAT